MTPADHTYLLISTVHASPSPQRLIEITGLGAKRKPVKRYFTDAALAASYAAELNAQQYSVFHGVNPHSEFAGFETSVPCVTALVLDLQPERTSIPGVCDLLTAHGIAPTITVCSGNGAHVYLLLDAETDPYAAKPAGERLVLATGSDRIFNTNRILGLAGTINWKTPPTWRYITGLWPERRYSLDTVISALDRMGAPPARKPHDGIPVPVEPPIPWQELRSKLSAGVLDIIDSGERNLYSELQTTRSEADWLVVCTLVRIGVSDEMIHWIYETQPVGLMKYRETGPRYLYRTIETARRATADKREARMSPAAYRPAYPNGSSRDKYRQRAAR